MDTQLYTEHVAAFVLPFTLFECFNASLSSILLVSSVYVRSSDFRRPGLVSAGNSTRGNRHVKVLIDPQHQVALLVLTLQCFSLSGQISVYYNY